MKKKKNVGLLFCTYPLQGGWGKFGKTLLVLLLFCVSDSVSASSGDENDWRTDFKPHYSGSIHVAYGTTSKVKGNDTYIGRVMVGTIHGVGFGKYGDAGVGVDAMMFTHYYPDQEMTFGVNPYLSIRPAIPFSKNAAAFVDFAIGASIPVTNKEFAESEMICHFAPGIRAKRFELSVGFEMLGTGEGSFTGFAKIGIRLGKN